MASVAQKMSWASQRTTTRTEDIAYCLLGIFDISMPLLYGEGEKAFVRLQEQIMENSDVQSLFAWEPMGLDTCEQLDLHSHLRNVGSSLEEGRGWKWRGTHLDNFQETLGVFARHPGEFLNSRQIVSSFGPDDAHYTLTNKGVKIEVPLIVIDPDDQVLVVLNCSHKTYGELLGIVMQGYNGQRIRLYRNEKYRLVRIERRDVEKFGCARKVYLSTGGL